MMQRALDIWSDCDGEVGSRARTVVCWQSLIVRAVGV
jgi:hypothetical protein